MNQQLLNLLMFCVPALITGAIAYMFFREQMDNEVNRRTFLLKKDLEREALPMRLQAYERMALFLERITFSKLLLRVKPTTSDKNDYEGLLIASIEQEFEHNLTQQIYLTNDCWGVINTAKNTTIQLIRKATMSEKVDSANKLREVLLNETMEKRPPSDVALEYIKKEVGSLWD